MTIYNLSTNDYILFIKINRFFIYFKHPRFIQHFIVYIQLLEVKLNLANHLTKREQIKSMVEFFHIFNTILQVQNKK